jgi:hypothetical protein
MYRQYITPTVTAIVPRYARANLVTPVAVILTVITTLYAGYAAVNGVSSVASGTQDAIGDTDLAIDFSYFMLAMRASLMFRSLTRIVPLLIDKVVAFGERWSKEAFLEATLKNMIIAYTGYVAVAYTLAQAPRLPEYEEAIGDKSDVSTYSGLVGLFALKILRLLRQKRCLNFLMVFLIELWLI